MILNYKVFGEGEPIIILHGLFGMLDNWQTFAKSLSADFKVFIVDQRNHGKSFHSSDFDYSLLASDLTTFLDNQDIDQAHIIGHSMGGKSAMQFANDYEDRVISLHVIDIAPHGYKASHLEIFQAIRSLDLPQLSNRKEANQALSLHIKEVAIRQFLLKNLGRSSDGFSWKANFDSLYNNYETILGPLVINHPINSPTSFIYSKTSGYVNKKDISGLQILFPKASFIEMDAGHWIHAEKPKELMSIIEDSLKKR